MASNHDFHHHDLTVAESEPLKPNLFLNMVTRSDMGSSSASSSCSEVDEASPTTSISSAGTLDRLLDGVTVHGSPSKVEAGRNSSSIEAVDEDLSAHPHLDALVVGAGWSGLWTLHRLRKEGFNVQLYEAKPDVGGVWLDTCYPGCRNETETPVYQFSDPKTWENWNWKERFPTQAEMHAYMRQVADVLDLRADIKFNARVEKAVWDGEKSHWVIAASGGVKATATYLLIASGYAGEKHVPNIPGLPSFKHAYHTSAWPKDIDVTNKRVAVIGTGSSGMQTIETIGPAVSHLTVFQRTPNLANPRYQEYLTAEQSELERKDYPARYEDMKTTQTGLEIRAIPRNTFDDDIRTRLAVYETLWARGAQNYWFGNYQDMLIDADANREAYKFWRSQVAPRIEDPAKRALLCPLEPTHAFGTKRPSLEETYFEVYNQDNVDLIDVNADPIVEVTEEGIKTASGTLHEVDIICLATGYDFAIGSQIAIPILGRHGISLKDKWLDPAGLATYLGLMTTDFPNCFFPSGPQAPTAFGITPRLAELQGDWITDTLLHVRSMPQGTIIEAKAEAEQSWKTMCDETVNKTLIRDTRGWYMGTNIPGRKTGTLFWFGGLRSYIDICNEIANDGYRGFDFK